MAEGDESRAVWRKSSRSNGSGGNCVEVAHTRPETIAIRDSKDPHGPRLLFSSGEWEAFTVRVRNGEFDLA